MRKSFPLYVERMVLGDIRCFELLEIQFSKPGESIVVTGDNGDGESTVLRALAMGICDQSSASALFRELYGDYVRAGSGSGDGTIQVDLRGRGRHRYRIETHNRSLDAFERVEDVLCRITGNRTKELSQEEFPWQRIFASDSAAYVRKRPVPINRSCRCLTDFRSLGPWAAGFLRVQESLGRVLLQ